MAKLTPIQVGRAAEHYVVAEIHRRGGWAACFGGNMPKIDVLASDHQQTRKVTIQVKAKYGGSMWQTSTRRGQAWTPADIAADAERFWILVDLRPDVPTYYVMPERWIENDIATNHAAYLERYGGQRRSSPDSTHHAIAASRVNQWLDRWEVLGIFDQQSSA